MSDTCDAEAFRCRCVRTPAHEPPHGCDCGGEWTGEGDSFEVVAFPTVDDDAFMAALVQGWRGVSSDGVRWPLP